MPKEVTRLAPERPMSTLLKKFLSPSTNAGITGLGDERLIQYYQSQVVRPAYYEGQLLPGFQRDLAIYHRHVALDDCDIYHCIDLPDGRHLAGAWDLRGHEDRYLGGALLDAAFFRGKLVAEFGPASGALTAHMAQDAAVTIFDLPFGAGPELVPFPGIDMAAAARSGVASVARLRNSWWYVKAQLGFEARAVYADIYNLPGDLPRFDVAVFGAILLHLSNPFRALQQAAALVDDTLIITEVDSAPQMPGLAHDNAQHPAIAAFNEGPPPSGIVHWWSFGPRAIMRMVERLGFEDVRVDLHTPKRMSGETRLFTVVGHRQRRVQVPVAARPSASSNLPVPPAEARFLVSGTDDIGAFMDLGRRGFDALAASLKNAGVAIENAGSILDFGCGVGRILRYWVDYPRNLLFGTDYQSAAIDWCRANLPFASFGINTLEPRLDYADESFDLIYCLSVFTHLPKSIHDAWFIEILRILKPGGLLYFTTHGRFYDYLLDGASRQAFDGGEMVVTGGDQPGTNVCATFHPVDYVMRAMIQPHGLTLVEHVPCGAKGNPNQDSYLVRKAPGRRADG
jgi:O-methyltransferase